MSKVHTTIPIAGLIAECRRELSVRNRVYPKWVQGGKINAADADYRLQCLKDTIAILEGVQREIAPELPGIPSASEADGEH